SHSVVRYCYWGSYRNYRNRRRLLDRACSVGLSKNSDQKGHCHFPADHCPKVLFRIYGRSGSNPGRLVAFGQLHRPVPDRYVSGRPMLPSLGRKKSEKRIWVYDPGNLLPCFLQRVVRIGLSLGPRGIRGFLNKGYEQHLKTSKKGNHSFSKTKMKYRWTEK